MNDQFANTGVTLSQLQVLYLDSRKKEGGSCPVSSSLPTPLEYFLYVYHQVNIFLIGEIEYPGIFES